MANSIIIEVNEEESSEQGGFGGRLKGGWEGETKLIFQPEAAERPHLVVKDIFKHNIQNFLWLYLWSTVNPRNGELLPLIDATRVAPGFPINLMF